LNGENVFKVTEAIGISRFVARACERGALEAQIIHPDGSVPACLGSGQSASSAAHTTTRAPVRLLPRAEERGHRLLQGRALILQPGRGSQAVHARAAQLHASQPIPQITARNAHRVAGNPAYPKTIPFHSCRLRLSVPAAPASTSGSVQPIPATLLNALGSSCPLFLRVV